VTVEPDLRNHDAVGPLHGVDTRRMPRRRSQSRGLVLGVVGVLFGLAILFGASWAIGHDKVDVSTLGDREQWVGNADRLAKRVAKDGPFILPDLSPNKGRVVYLQHVGDKDDAGWSTILAGSEECPVQWDGSKFVDCRGTYPADGAGLTRYKTWVDRNGVYVDLRVKVE
jgi:hypothetical protein